MDRRLHRKLNRQLWLFGKFKIPLIGFCFPRIRELDNDHITVRIPLNRRTRNHVKSMYLGVMTVGADLASGFLAFHLLEQRGIKAAPVFKSMSAEYYKRAESAVDFVCDEGKNIDEMIDEMKATGERVNRKVLVKAICQNEEVAQFKMEISFKEIKKKT